MSKDTEHNLYKTSEEPLANLPVNFIHLHNLVLVDGPVVTAALSKSSIIENYEKLNNQASR